MVLASTDELWTVDGLPLNAYCWAIASLGGGGGGGRFDFPPLRGSNRTYAYRPGAVFLPKVADQRTITLTMWVAGVDPATGQPGANPVVQWNDNWNTLRRAFWTPRRQVTLDRKWKLNVSAPSLLEAAAQAQFQQSSTPLAMTGRARADFAVDFQLADPFFYGAPIMTTVISGTPVTIHNPGDDAAAYAGVTVEFIGGTNPVLTNTTASPVITCSAAGAIGDITLDVRNFLVSPGSYPLGSIGHSGARSWFVLLPGDNTVTLTGGGTAKVTFSPPYL
jgi:hypothetical protein